MLAACMHIRLTGKDTAMATGPCTMHSWGESKPEKAGGVWCVHVGACAGQGANVGQLRRPGRRLTVTWLLLAARLSAFAYSSS